MPLPKIGQESKDFRALESLSSGSEALKIKCMLRNTLKSH